MLAASIPFSVDLVESLAVLRIRGVSERGEKGVAVAVEAPGETAVVSPPVLVVALEAAEHVDVRQSQRDQDLNVTPGAPAAALRSVQPWLCCDISLLARTATSSDSDLVRATATNAREEASVKPTERMPNNEPLKPQAQP